MEKKSGSRSSESGTDGGHHETSPVDVEIISAMQRVQESQPTCYDYLFFCLATQIFTIGHSHRAAIAPITDVLEDEFSATSSQIGLCSSILFIGFCSMQIPSGMALQLYSADFVSLLCSIGMGVCLFLFVFSQNIEMATISQLFAGIAQSATSISLLATIDQRLGSEMVPLCFGIVILYCYIHMMVMQYIQAMLYDSYSVWRPPFYYCGTSCFVLGLISLIALMIETNRKRENNDKKKEKSPHSNANANGRHNDINHVDDVVKATNCNKRTSIDTGESISRRQSIHLRDPDPKSKDKQSVWHKLKKSLQNPLNHIYALYYFLVSVVWYGFYGLWFIPYLMLKFHYQRTTATLISASGSAALALSAPIWGLISKRSQRRKIFLVLGAIGLVSSLVVIAIPDTASMFAVMGSTVVAGIATGSWSAFWPAVRESNVYYQCEDVAVGLITSFGNSAGFFSQYLIGLMLDWRWNGDVDDDGARLYRVQDYNFAFSTLVVSVVGSILVSLLMQETYAKPLDLANRRSGQSNTSPTTESSDSTSPESLSPESLSPESLSPECPSPECVSPDTLSPDSTELERTIEIEK